MKYFLFALLLVLAAVVLLICVAVIKAVTNKKTVSDKKAAISWTKDEEDAYAHCLSEMVKVPTLSKKKGEDYSEFLKLQAVMAELFSNIFTKLEAHHIDGNMLFRWAGKDSSKEGILLMGHQDVVPAEEKEWEHDPFSGLIEDGVIKGRGAMDCKSTLCAEFAAVEELLKEGFVPERDVWLASSVNEENSGGGAETLVEYLLSKGIRLSCVMDEGGAVMENAFPGLEVPCAAIGLVEKGFVNLKVIARGKGGHASTPPKNTPIVRLSKFICEVEKSEPFTKAYTSPIPEMFQSIAPYMTFPLRLVLSNMWLFKGVVKKVLPMLSSMGGAFLSTTCAFTMSDGSSAPNVLPDYAYVICNIRPSVHQNAEESVAVLREIAKKYDLEVEVMFSRDASNTSPMDSKEYAYLKKCLNECFPDVVVTPYLMTGGTDCRQFERVCDNCLRFTPTRLTNQQLAAMHAANENIGVSALAEAVKFYRYFIEKQS